MPKRIRRARQFRRCSSGNSRINNKIARGDWEDLPKKEKMDRQYMSDWDHDTGGLSYGYSSRWMEKQVGRVWEDVYSEICRDIPWYQRDVFLCQIEHNTIMIDGEIYETRYRLTKLRAWSRKSLYVHPETRIICRLESTKYERPVDPNKKTIDGKTYERFDNTWFEVEYQKSEYSWWLFGRNNVITHKKKTLSKKELKKLGLKD